MILFTELEVWKKSRIIRNKIYNLANSFPQAEKFRLGDQIIRSSRSIGNNIAEGHGRYHYADAAKFLLNARGSTTETIDHLIIALDLNYIDKETFKEYKSDCEECLRMINGYIKYLKEKKNES